MQPEQLYYGEKRAHYFVDALFIHLDENAQDIDGALAYIGVTVKTLERWRLKEQMPRGVTILFGESFLRQRGSELIEPIKLDDPPTIVQALEKGLSEKIFSIEDLVQETGVNPGAVVGWVVRRDNNPAGGFIGLKLRYFLHQKNLRSFDYPKKISLAAKHIINLICVHKISEHAIADRIKVPIGRIGSWIRAESSPIQQMDVIIQKLSAADFENGIKPVQAEIPEAEEVEEELMAQNVVKPPDAQIPNILNNDEMEKVLNYTFAWILAFLRLTSRQQREEFRRQHPELAHQLNMVTSALCSEEALSQLRKRGQI